MVEEIGFLDVLYSTRSIRLFKAEEVSSQLIRKILEAATQAPSGANKQPWKFLVIRDSVQKNYLGTAYLKGSAEYQGISVNKLSSEKNKSPVNYLASHFSKAPVLLVVCSECLNEGTDSNSSLNLGSSIFPAVQNILLAARFYGLGGVITISNRFQDQELKDALGIPKGWSISTVIPIGYPEGKHGAKTRKHVEQVTFSDWWGSQPKF